MGKPSPPVVHRLHVAGGVSSYEGTHNEARNAPERLHLIQMKCLVIIHVKLNDLRLINLGPPQTLF